MKKMYVFVYYKLIENSPEIESYDRQIVYESQPYKHCGFPIEKHIKQRAPKDLKYDYAKLEERYYPNE